MGGPKVSRSHEIEREACKIVASALPSAWVSSASEQGTDYGVDLWVQIARNGELTPQRVAIQIKGTGDPRKSTVRLKRTTLEMLAGLSDLAIILKVNVSDRRIWVVPANDHRIIRELGEEGAKSDVTVKLTEHDLIEEPDTLATRIDIMAYRQWYNSRAGIPVPIWIEAVGWNSAEALGLLREVQAQLPREVRLDRFPPDERHLIQAHLHYGSPPSMRDSARPSRPLQRPFPEAEGPLETLLIIATGLLDIGLGKVAARVAEIAIPQVDHLNVLKAVPLASTILKHLGGSSLGAMLARACGNGRLWAADLLSIVETWEADLNLPESTVQDIFEAAIDSVGDPEGVAMLRVNHARHLWRVKEFDRAIELIQIAAGETAVYGRASHLRVELGGMYATLHRDTEAVDAYRNAARLGANKAEMAARIANIQLRMGAWSVVVNTWESQLHVETDRCSLLMGHLTWEVARLWIEIFGAKDVVDENRLAVEKWLTEHSGVTDVSMDEVTEHLVMDPVNLEMLRVAHDVALDVGDIGVAFMCTFTAAMIEESNAGHWVELLDLIGRVGFPDEYVSRTSAFIFEYSASFLGGRIADVLKEIAPEELQRDLTSWRQGLERLKEQSRPRILNIRVGGRFESIKLT